MWHNSIVIKRSCIFLTCIQYKAFTRGCGINLFFLDEVTTSLRGYEIKPFLEDPFFSNKVTTLLGMQEIKPLLEDSFFFRQGHNFVRRVREIAFTRAFFFLDASTQLYMRVSPSVRLSVHQSIRWLVGNAFFSQLNSV